MKQIRIFHGFLMMFSLHIACLSGKNMIMLTMRPFPGKNEIPVEKFLEKTQFQGKTSYKMLKNVLSAQTFQGIVATYYGYTTHSDFNGQIAFPRKHQKDMVQLLVTTLIEPIMMIDATVHHWQVMPNIPARLYTLERKEDTDTKTYYWDAKEEKIPENKIISLETIVLFADPDNVLVPTGITLTTKSPHLILPNVYTLKEIKRAANALRVLKINHFFGPLSSEIKKQSDVYYSRQW